MTSAFDNLNWSPPAHWTRIKTIDMHTGGEPLRVITSGLPTIEGRTVLEKRSYFRKHYDHLRTGLMWEPRGHADMYGAVVTTSQTADLDVFFLHNEGYSTMCGHAIIALTTLAVETGHVRTSNGEANLTINVPAGTVQARAVVRDGKAVAVSFRNVASFAYLRNQRIEVPGVGSVRFDIAYGGAFYAIVAAEPLGLELTEHQYNRLIDYGRRIKNAVMAHHPIEHPFERELSFLYGTIFTGRASDPSHHSRNVTIFAEGEVDRSATGSGVSARAALHHASGELGDKQEITIESILGSTMSVRVVDKMKFGPYDAVTPEVSGTACYTGRHEFWFDPADRLNRGFIFR